MVAREHVACLSEVSMQYLLPEGSVEYEDVG